THPASEPLRRTHDGSNQRSRRRPGKTSRLPPKNSKGDIMKLSTRTAGLAALALSMSLGLAACGDSDEDSTANNDSSSSSSPMPSEDASMAPASVAPFGPPCDQIPAEGEGSASTMAAQPVGTA